METIYKVLGQAAPADTNNANLYVVPAGAQAVASTFRVANVTATAATFRVWVRINGAAVANSNAIAMDVPLAGNSIFSATEGMTLNAGDIITVRSGTANALTFTLFGSEIS
jgi:2-keto-4-pentenoate hydratase/2-oxohepta-3-ene-1,7-dioic acid hydratase in catechol pathway